MMNTEHFLVLAGDCSKWDQEILEAKAADAMAIQAVRRSGLLMKDPCFSLCRAQRAQHSRGRRSAEVCRTIHGWSVRAGSGLDGFRLMHAKSTLPAAIEWGIRWANRDPESREFYIRRSALGAPIVGYNAMDSRHTPEQATQPVVAMAWNSKTGAVSVAHAESVVGVWFQDPETMYDRIVVVGSDEHLWDGESWEVKEVS